MKLVETTIKAVIFDYDGTLVDTETIYNLVHKKLTGRDLDYESKIQLMGRLPLEACQLTVKLFNIDMTPEEYLKICEEAFDPS
jgi:pseudouridine-5'-monophosphatase